MSPTETNQLELPPQIEGNTEYEKRAEKALDETVEWPVSIEIDGNTFRDLKAEIKRVYEKDTLTDEEAIDFSIQLIKDWITYR